MAPKSSFSSLLLVHTLLFILLPLLSQAHTLTNNSSSSSSKVAFLQHLQGCHKGDTRKDIPMLKQYLAKYGYLSSSSSDEHSNIIKDDYFDPSLERALKTYQTNFHLNPTGTMDPDTIATMMTPRCGVADIINDTNTMQRSLHHHHKSSGGRLRTVSHFSFLPGRPRWSRTRLTYSFLPGTLDIAIDPVSRAFQTWAANSQFQFQRVSGGRSDITVGFGQGDHGAGSDFDGRGGVLAHAYAPEDGRFHYDGAEPWGVRRPDAYDLETLALHEIGHLLGLGHSNVQGSVMKPGFGLGESQGLHQDDVQGIRVLYGL